MIKVWYTHVKNGKHIVFYNWYVLGRVGSDINKIIYLNIYWILNILRKRDF